MGGELSGSGDMAWALANGLMVVNNLVLAHGAFLTWNRFVGVSGGGIRLGVDGIDSLTDAGAAGVPAVTFDPTNDTVRYGSATWNFIVAPTGGYISCQSPSFKMNVATTYVALLTGGNLGLRITGTNGDATEDGWLLAKGVGCDLGNDFNFDDWAVIGGAAGYQMQTPITAQVALQDGFRGGVVNIWSVLAAAPNWLEVSGQIHSWSAQDAYRIYTRFCDNQIADISSWVGVSDGPAGANPYGAVAGNGIGIVQDDAVGANYLLRQVVGGAVVDDSTGTAAVAGAFHRWDVLVSALGLPTLYYDGTLVATGAILDSPLPTTMLEPLLWVANLGAAILAELLADCFKIVQSRNTTVNP